MNWPTHKTDCNGETDIINVDDPGWVLNDTKNPEVFKKMKKWNFIHGPVILWAMQQAYMQNQDLDPREHLFHLVLESDHLGGFPSRFRPLGITIVPSPDLTAMSKSETQELWYSLSHMEETTGKIHRLTSVKTVPSDWKEKPDAHEGTFDVWNYVFSYTCFSHSLTKRAAVFRANFLVEAARINRAKEAADGSSLSSLLGGRWIDLKNPPGLPKRAFHFNLRKAWGLLLDLERVWEVMEESGALTHILENSCGVADYRGSLEVVRHSTAA